MGQFNAHSAKVPKNWAHHWDNTVPNAWKWQWNLGIVIHWKLVTLLNDLFRWLQVQTNCSLRKEKKKCEQKMMWSSKLMMQLADNTITTLQRYLSRAEFHSTCTFLYCAKTEIPYVRVSFPLYIPIIFMIFFLCVRFHLLWWLADHGVMHKLCRQNLRALCKGEQNFKHKSQRWPLSYY